VCVYVVVVVVVVLVVVVVVVVVGVHCTRVSILAALELVYTVMHELTVMCGTRHATTVATAVVVVVVVAVVE